MTDHVFTVGHMFCGIGGSAIGAQGAVARFEGHSASFKTLGGVDFDAAACRDFETLTGAPALCADLHTLQPAELLKAWGPRRPDVVMSSPPCKGFSRLLSSKKAAEPQYQEMNQLLLRSLFLLCSTWDEPPPLMFFENVPGIMSRGKAIVEEALKILHAHGYSVDIGTHDCGEIGGLAQRRPRWFLAARCRRRLPNPVYQPVKLRVRACGEVIGPLPMPGDPAAGPMHAVPRMSWNNWKRLAAIPAGGDWRDLGGVIPEGKQRRDVHRRHSVLAFNEPAPAVTGPGGHAAEAVADPRPFSNIMMVTGWDDPARSVVGASRVGSGALSVSDPRWFNGIYGVRSFDEPAPAVTGNARACSGGFAVADPRFAQGKKKNWQQVAGVTPWDQPGPTVISNAKIHAGAFQVADPRPFNKPPRATAYKVMRWDEAAGTVTAYLSVDNGPAAVADPRFGLGLATEADIAAAEAAPNKCPPFIPFIIAPDNTCHRPLTTLELAALQGLDVVINGKPLVLDGKSHTRWRMAIGNMVPPPSARAVANQLVRALLLSDCGVFELSATPIWVSPQPEAA